MFFIIDDYIYNRSFTPRRVLVVQSLRYVKDKMITTNNKICNLLQTWGNFFMLIYIIRQVGVYTPRGVVPPARHLSHIVHTKIGNIIDTTKGSLSYLLNKVINNIPTSPDLGMGVLLSYRPLPPSVSPPYMTF